MKSIDVRRRGRGVWLAVCAVAVAIALPAPIFAQANAAQTGSAQAAAAPVEQGKFILHKFEQPIGQETYEVTKDGDSLVVKMDFKFTDRGSTGADDGFLSRSGGLDAGRVRDQGQQFAQHDD